MHLYFAMDGKSSRINIRKYYDATYGVGLFTPTILGALEISARTRGLTAHNFALAEGSAVMDSFLLIGFLFGVWMVPRFGRIRMQVIGFAGMAAGMLILLAALGLTNSSLHIPLVFVGFILFNLLMNAGPNSTTSTFAPILFPTQLRGTAGGFAAGLAKLGATLGVFLLPIVKRKIRTSERSWNCVGGKSAGSDHNFRSPSRGHGFPIVWNSRGGRKVIFFSVGAHGNTETTARLFRSK
jgi:MFS family permease